MRLWMTFVRPRAPSSPRCPIASDKTWRACARPARPGAASDRERSPVLGRQALPLLKSEGAVGGELVEPAGGALGGSARGDFGEHVPAVPMLPISAADSAAIAVAARARCAVSKMLDSIARGFPADRLSDLAGLGVRLGAVWVTTTMVLESRPRVAPGYRAFALVVAVAIS